jgi:hypothetical protein
MSGSIAWLRPRLRQLWNLWCYCTHQIALQAGEVSFVSNGQISGEDEYLKHSVHLSDAVRVIDRVSAITFDLFLTLGINDQGPWNAGDFSHCLSLTVQHSPQTGVLVANDHGGRIRSGRLCFLLPLK